MPSSNKAGSRESLESKRAIGSAVPDTRRWLSHLNRQAGHTVSRYGPNMKTVARGCSLSLTRIYQLRGGDSTGAPQHLIRLLDKLARHPRLNPYPLLGLGHVIVEDALASHDPDVLQTRLGLVLEDETRSQASADIAEFRLVQHWDADRLDGFIDFGEIHAANLLEAVGVARVLRRQFG